MTMLNAQEQTITLNGSITNKLIVTVSGATTDEIMEMGNAPITALGVTYFGYTRIAAYHYDIESGVYTAELEKVSELEQEVKRLGEKINTVQGIEAGITDIQLALAEIFEIMIGGDSVG